MNEQTKRTMMLVISLLKLALLAAVPVFWGAFLSIIPSIYEPDDTHFYDILKYNALPHWFIPLIAFLSYAFMLYRVMKQAAIYDLGGTEDLSAVRFRERLNFTVRRRGFRLCLITISAVYILAPFGTFYGSVLAELTPGKPQGVWLAILGRAVLLISASAIILLSYVSAVGNVIRARNSVRKHKGDKSGFIKRLARALLTPALIPLFFICMILPYVKPMRYLIPLLISPAALTVYGVVISVPCAIYAVSIVRAVAKRRVFCRELEALCKSEGFECTPIKRRLISSFLWTDGESFRVKVHGKTYSCKLIGVARKRNEHLILRENGVCMFRRPVRLRGIELFSFVTTRDFRYDSDGAQKILIINPVPQNILTFRHGKWEDADNGDAVDEYKIFAGSAFLRALRSDVLSRDVNGK